MCGIFGYVGRDGKAADIVLRGLQQLEYRGYDSWGIAVASEGNVAVDKRVGNVRNDSPDLFEPIQAAG